LFEAGQVAMLALDPDGAVSAMTPAAESLLGYGQADLVGQSAHGRLHYQRSDGRTLPPAECPVLAALAESRPAAGDGEVLVRVDGSVLPVSWAVAPIVLAGMRTGGIVAFVPEGCGGDERARAAARVAAVEAANLRLNLLAAATEALAGERELSMGLARLARQLVPVIGDWIVIDLVDDMSGRLERVALAHRDPALEAAGLARLGRLPSLTAACGDPLARVVSGGPAERIRDFGDRRTGHDPLAAARRELFTLLGSVDALTAPLRSQGRTFGAVTVVRSDAARPYLTADLAFVSDLAGRIAATVENAWLADRERRRGEQLQRALLPDLAPRVGGIEVPGTYAPATDLLHVGGDWYDALALPDGSVGLIIGDMAGHDLHAATRMAAVRHKLRSLAVDRVGPPSEVVTRLDTVLRHLAPHDLATLIYARLSPRPDGGWRLTWSCAGHLPPLLVLCDGSALLLDPAVDLPVGVAELPRSDQEHDLPPGAVLLFYTDGLVEHRGASLDEGLARLLGLAPALRGLPLPEIGARLIELAEPAGEDDVAVLAVRLP
jgi:hypothetical protein